MTEEEFEKLAQIGLDVEYFKALEQQGNPSLISRISLLVEQERLLRAEHEKISKQLEFITRKKHEHYEALQNPLD